MTDYNCPACGSLQEVSANLVGIAVNCSSCGNTFLPAAEGPGIINPAGARNSSSIRRKSGSRHKRNPGPLLVIALAFVVMTVIVVLIIGSSGKGNRGIVNGQRGKSTISDLSLDDAIVALEDLGAIIRPFPIGGGYEIDLSETSVADDDLIYLQAFKSKFYTRINLRKTQITDRGLHHIRGFRRLSSLDLSYTHVTDSGLGNLTEFLNLGRLDLENTRITDKGLMHLKGLKSLRTLSLKGTRGITDKGLMHLKELKSLRSVYLQGTSVTDAGVAELGGTVNFLTGGTSFPVDGNRR